MKHNPRFLGKCSPTHAHELPRSLSFFHFPAAWTVGVSLEVQQPYWDYEVASLRMEATVLRMVEQKHRCG